MCGAARRLRLNFFGAGSYYVHALGAWRTCRNAKTLGFAEGWPDKSEENPGKPGAKKEYEHALTVGGGEA
jgi:hypothetical protein